MRPHPPSKFCPGIVRGETVTICPAVYSGVVTTRRHVLAKAAALMAAAAACATTFVKCSVCRRLVAAVAGGFQPTGT